MTQGSLTESKLYNLTVYKCAYGYNYYNKQKYELYKVFKNIIIQVALHLLNSLKPNRQQRRNGLLPIEHSGTV